MIGLRALAVEEVAGAEPASQAAALRRACGHVHGEASLVREHRYRFYPMPAQDLPSFFNKRFAVGRRIGSVTLIAGLDPVTGLSVLDAAGSTDDAVRALDRGPGGIWLVRLTLGNATIVWQELTTGFPRLDPSGFAVIAAELLALPLCARRACPLCRV